MVRARPERAQSHMIAAHAYSTIRRKLEIIRLGLPDTAADLKVIIRQLSALSETTPVVPIKIWKRAVREEKAGEARRQARGK